MTMNPQFDKPTSMDLPPPLPENTPAGEIAGATPEVAATMELAHQPAPPAVSTIQPPLPISTAPIGSQPQANPAVTAVPATTSSLAANDSDLIEKEWVAKAKEVIERNREDPHLQTKEMSAVKADYMKKRYNKELKLVDEK